MAAGFAPASFYSSLFPLPSSSLEELKMRYTFVLSLILSAFPLSAQTAEPRTISVSVEAVVRVGPNQAVVTIGVETFDPSLEVASEKNDLAARAMIGEWKKLGVTDASIKTSGVQLEIAYTN